MLLKTFNLTQLIKQYNITNGANIPEDSNFGFSFFQKSSLDDINQKIALINEGHELYVFDEEEMNFIKLERKQLRETINHFSRQLPLNKLKQSGIYKNLPLTLGQIEILRKQIKCKIIWREWLNKELNTLNNKILNEFKEPNIAYQQFPESIKEQSDHWSKHKSLALFNDTALFRITSEILPFLYHYLQKARTSLKASQHLIPIDISTQFIKYLKELEQDLQNIQSTIVESMLARLLSFDQSRGAYSNPILHMANKLNPARTEPKQPYQLSAQEFNFFHQYIEKHGNYSAKLQLHKRNWYTSNSILATTVIKSHDNGYIIVPEKLAQFIPLKKRWPSFLFGDINLRQDLFLDNTFLFANLKMFANRPTYFLDIYDVKSLREPLEEINKNEILINESIFKLKTPPYSTIWWFSFGTKAVLKNWHNHLLEQKFILCEAKLNLAERLVNCLKSQLTNPFTVPWESYELLIGLSQELEALVKNQSSNKALQDRMYAINTVLTRFAPIKKFIEILEKLANNTLLSAEQLDYLTAFIDRHIEQEKDFITNLTKYSKLTLEKIVDNLMNQLKISPITHQSVDDLKNQEKLIMSYYAVIERLKNNEINYRIENKIKFFFLRYLQYSMNQDITKYAKHFVVYKNILSTIGKNVKYLDKSISDHLKCLEKQKSENNFLFNINCKSLESTLANHFLLKRFNKELVQFDNELTHVLEQKHLSPEIITSLVKKRDALSSSPSFENIKFTLSEQTLLGMSSSKHSNANLLSLFQLSIKAHNIKNKLESNISFEEKSHFVKTLSQSVSDYLSHNNSVSEMSKRKWFTMQIADDNPLNNKDELNGIGLLNNQNQKTL